MGERFFSSGNERTPTAFADIAGQTVKSAFKIDESTRFGMQLELMNMDNVEKQVWYTAEYEYLPEAAMTGFKNAKAIWLDVTNCGTSFVSAPADKKKFTYQMRPWKSTFNGQLLDVGEFKFLMKWYH